MSKRLTTAAIVATAFFGMTGLALAQNTGNRANDPELNHNTQSSPSGAAGMTMPSQQKGNMGTVGQGGASNSQIHDKTGNGGNGSPRGGSEGRVNSHTQE